MPKPSAICTTACSIDEVYKAAILAARTRIEHDPAYTCATARLLQHTIRREILGEEVTHAEMATRFTPSTSPPSSRRASKPSCWTTRWASSTWSPGRRAEVRPRPELRLPRPANPVRPLLPAHEGKRIEMPQAFFMRVAMGSGAERNRPRRRPRHRVLRTAVVVRLHVVHADAVQLRHPSPQLSSCYLTTVPDDLDGIYEAIKENALLSKFAAAWATTGPRCARWAAHQGHQRQIARRGPLPQGGQRHRRGGEPGRQAQGRGLRLPGNLAPRHRRVPGTAQEHRRRPPPHPRHEHRQLDPRPVHARVWKVANGRCSRPPTARTCTTCSAPTFEEAYSAYEAKAAAARSSLQAHARPSTCGARCCRCCSKPAIPGSPSRMPATCARRSSTSGVVHSSNLCTEITLNTSDTKSRSATWARSTWCSTSRTAASTTTS